jgi:hypothetical protein
VPLAEPDVFPAVKGYGHGFRPRPSDTGSATDQAAPEHPNPCASVSGRDSDSDSVSVSVRLLARVAPEPEPVPLAEPDVFPAVPGHARGRSSLATVNQSPRHGSAPIEKCFGFGRSLVVDRAGSLQQSQRRTRLERRAVRDPPVVLPTSTDVTRAFGQVQRD